MYTLDKIAQIVGGKLTGEGTHVVDILSIDSRKIIDPSRTLFFAIKTTKDDGHRYVSDAVSKGVGAVVVSEPPSGSCNYILVKDPLKALQQLSAYHRQSFACEVVGITGSNGKTIVKEWLAHLAANHYHVCKNPKSYNSQVGVPLSVWNLRNNHSLGIFEAGISLPGEMDTLENIIQPTLGIFTHLGDAHALQFESLESKLDEKIKLFKRAKTIVAPGDDLLVRDKIKALGTACFFWGHDHTADLRVIHQSETSVEVEYQQQRHIITLSSYDRSCFENTLTALAAGLCLGIPINHLVNAAPQLPVVDMRLQQVTGINNNQLILDFYNSDFRSISIALDFLAQQATHSKKTLILSDVVESDLDPDQLYRKLNSLLHHHKMDRLIGIGETIRQKQHLLDLEMETYASTEEFLRSFPFYTLRNESILLKGARRFEFEKIAEKLREKTHQTVLEVNLSRMQENIRSIKQHLRPTTKMMTMVKALGYGSGGYQVAKLLEFNNIDYLGVAYTDEATELVQSGINLPFIVLNPDLNDLDPYIEHAIQPVIYSFESLEKLNNHAVRIHLEFDTGMHRLGFLKTDIPKVLEFLNAHPNVRVVSVFSHLVGADEERLDDLTRKQIADFEAIGAQLKDKLGNDLLMHLSNTAGIERFPEAQFNMVRLGIGLYGISSGRRTNLQPVSSFKTYITQIKELAANEGVGYGHRDAVDRKRKIATLAVGYADGFNRKFSQGVGHVRIGGKKAPVVGNVCMDMTMVDVTDIYCKAGDEAILFGDHPRVEELASAIDTIPYEILTNVSERVNRVFYQE